MLSQQHDKLGGFHRRDEGAIGPLDAVVDGMAGNQQLQLLPLRAHLKKQFVFGQVVDALDFERQAGLNGFNHLPEQDSVECHGGLSSRHDYITLTRLVGIGYDTQ